MERVTISVSDGFASELNDFMALRGYTNRSEALRDLVRMGLEQVHKQKQQSHGTYCLGVVIYVFNHQTRELAKRLLTSHHMHHELNVASMHVHLDHDHCLEIALLRGPTLQVESFAETIIAERGVLHGQVAMIPINVTTATHTHGTGNEAHQHMHIQPLG